jgi:hypothetical protein
MFEQ